MDASDPLAIAMAAAYGIVDGIDGMMSETGDFPGSFWKRDVLSRYDKLGALINRSAGKDLDPRDVMKLRKDVQELLDDLVDGLEGVVSEQGEVPDRYWKRNVLSKGKKALRDLKRAPKASLQPLRSRRDYGEEDMNNQKIARELLKVARELTATESLIDQVLDQRKLARLQDDMDEQTYDLMVEVFRKLADDFRLSSKQQEALNRLKMSMEGRYQPDMHRNNIFKAAHALGMKLPSSMF
jgi:hypothetical protein